MNLDLVFVKTAAGEEAMRVQTKVMQRNVRTVLILVDGHSTVAQLSSKMSNLKLTENALIDLERGGFIVRRENDASGTTAQASDGGNGPATTEMQYPELVSLPDEPMTAPEIQKETVPASTSSVSPGAKTSLSLLPVKDEPPPPAEKPKRRQVATPAQPSLIVRLREWWMARRMVTGGSDDIVFRRGKRAGWKQWLALSILAGIVLVVLTALLFPFSIFLPEIEALMSRSIGRQATVGEMEVSFYPKPGIVLRKVSVALNDGVSGDGPRLSIPEVLLEPVVTKLLSPAKEFRSVVLRDLMLPVESLPVVLGISGALRDHASSIGIAQIRFERVTLDMLGMPFAGMEGEVVQAKGEAASAIRLRSSDRSLTITAKPLKSRIDFEVEGFGQHLPTGGAVTIDSISAQGSVERGTLTFKAFDLRVLDGMIQGSAVVLAGKKINIAGDLVFERINSGRLCNVLGAGELLSGDIGGRVRFVASANAWNELFASMQADGDFVMQRGSLRGIDLAEAVRRGAGTPVQGGLTNFEQLSGKIRVSANGGRFYGITMNSGLMQSIGSVEIDQNRSINGRMDLQIRGSVNQSRVPITLGGSLKSPTTQAGRR